MFVDCFVPCVTSCIHIELVSEGPANYFALVLGIDVAKAQVKVAAVVCYLVEVIFPIIYISHNKKSLAYFILEVKRLFALPTHKVFKVVPFVSLAAINVVLLTASATSAGNHLSVGLKNLFTSNVYISHNWKQYSIVSEKRKHFFHFFSLFF